MSKLFGPVVQQGYVVPDIDKAMQHWISRGVGPFYIEKHISPPCEINGKKAAVDISAAFAYSGDQQIEVIVQHNDVPTIYKQYLDKHSEGGLQHLAVWCDNIDEKLAEIGDQWVVHQRYGDGHAYLDNKKTPGIMIQLMAHSEAIDTMFRFIKAGADSWDGVTDPIRIIDWSTGLPVVKAAK
tara:strand:+ start:358 stop:903 length:546 start_codon:yes stop_codon:yes gene_type:complete